MQYFVTLYDAKVARGTGDGAWTGWGWDQGLDLGLVQVCGRC